MATNTHGGGGRQFDIDSTSAQERLAKIRGMASDGRSYKERTGQAPLSERAQSAVETALETIADVLTKALEFIGGNWKMLLIGAVALVIVLRK